MPALIINTIALNKCCPKSIQYYIHIVENRSEIGIKSERKKENEEKMKIETRIDMKMGE